MHNEAYGKNIKIIFFCQFLENIWEKKHLYKLYLLNS